MKTKNFLTNLAFAGLAVLAFAGGVTEAEAAVPELSITISGDEPDTAVLMWDSDTSCEYRLWQTADLMDTWAVSEDWQTGTGAFISEPKSTVGLDKMFYRVECKLISTSDTSYTDPVGFVKIEVRRNDYNQIAIPLIVEDMALNDTSDSVACVGEILSQTLIGQSIPDHCPTIYEYQFGGGFEGAFLYDSGGGNEWDNKWYNTQTYSLSDMVLNNTTGYYLKRSGDPGPEVQHPIISGDVEVADTVAVHFPPAYSMITYPYPVTIGINDSEWLHTEDGAHGDPVPDDCDKIYRYNAGGGFEGAFLYDSGKSSVTDNKWYNTHGGLSTMTFNPGEGYYYWRNPTYGSFDWVVDRPFNVD